MESKLKSKISNILMLLIGLMIVVAICVSFETIYDAGKDFGSNVTEMIFSFFEQIVLVADETLFTLIKGVVDAVMDSLVEALPMLVTLIGSKSISWTQIS